MNEKIYESGLATQAIPTPTPVPQFLACICHSAEVYHRTSTVCSQNRLSGGLILLTVSREERFYAAYLSHLVAPASSRLLAPKARHSERSPRSEESLFTLHSQPAIRERRSPHRLLGFSPVVQALLSVPTEVPPRRPHRLFRQPRPQDLRTKKEGATQRSLLDLNSSSFYFTRLAATITSSPFW